MDAKPDPPGLDSEPRLSVEDVMALYPRLRTRRAARAYMNEVGAFVTAGALYVRRSDLLAHEEALMAARRPSGAAPPVGSSRSRTRPEKRPSRSDHEELSPDWHRRPLETP